MTFDLTTAEFNASFALITIRLNDAGLETPGELTKLANPTSVEDLHLAGYPEDQAQQLVNVLVLKGALRRMPVPEGRLYLNDDFLMWHDEQFDREVHDDDALCGDLQEQD